MERDAIYPSRRYSGATVTAVTCPCHLTPGPSAFPMTAESPAGSTCLKLHSSVGTRFVSLFCASNDIRAAPGQRKESRAYATEQLTVAHHSTGRRV